jgi:hypothetical protein
MARSALVHGGKIAATRVRSRGCASRAAIEKTLAAARKAAAIADWLGRDTGGFA